MPGLLWGVQSFIDNGVRPELIPILISFFQNRDIQVKWNGFFSSPLTVTGGGPQGGTAGGILEYLSQTANNLSFLPEDEAFKYIDDSNFLEILNLACIGLSNYNAKLHVPSDMAIDDFYLSPENIKTQEHIDTINKWTHAHEMKLNSSKTNYMIVNYCTSAKFETRLYLENQLLDQVHESTLLGVIISDDLKWNKNTQSIVKRAYKRMSILRSLVKFRIPKCDLVLIYMLYVRSILEQSSVVWSTSITQDEVLALERVQKCALRLIYQSEYLSYSNALYMSGLPDLSSRRLKLLHNFADKCVQNEATQFMFPLNEHKYNTRHPEKYQVPMALHTRLKDLPIIAMAEYLNKHAD